MILEIGAVGTDVSSLHQLLLEAGENVDLDELRSRTFGLSTKTAVLDFQASHVDPKGRSLAQDGIVGPITMSALRAPRAPTESFTASGWRYGLNECRPQERPVIEAAVREIGVKEDPPGSNRGPRVDAYCGKEWLGSPWCALWISWCWKYAEMGSPFGKLASAYKIKEWGTQRQKILSAGDPARPGDIGVIMRAEGRGHVELVVGVERPDEPLCLIGGNVSNSVRGTVRAREQFTCIVRPLREV